MPSASWKKSPQAIVERFGAALPAHPHLVRKPMFGYPAAFVNGNMVCGLFQSSVIVRLGKEGAAAVTSAGQAKQFAPMPGRTMTGYVVVPDADVEGNAALSAWLHRALDFTLTLPAKPSKAEATAAAGSKSKRKP